MPACTVRPPLPPRTRCPSGTWLGLPIADQKVREQQLPDFEPALRSLCNLRDDAQRKVKTVFNMIVTRILPDCSMVTRLLPWPIGKALKVGAWPRARPK